MSTTKCSLQVCHNRAEQIQLWTRFCTLATQNNQAHVIDPYFNPDYLHLNQWIESGEPVVLYAEQDNHAYWYSFMLRPLPDAVAVSGYDITSPYGFGGELFTGSATSEKQRFLKQCQSRVIEWCQKNDVVAEFIRFHPLLKNHLKAPDSIQTHHVKTVCWFDLKQSEEQLWKNLHSQKRRYLKKIDTHDVQISDDWHYLSAFSSLYAESMTQKQASQFYQFPSDFFEALENINDEQRWLRTLLHQGRPVGSALFLKHGEHVQYFLGANNQTAKERHLSAWLLFQTALDAKHDGYKTFTLGGGLSENDSLFRFKNQLTKTTAPYYIGTRIHNAQKYEAIKANLKSDPLVETASELPLFFYRAHLELKR